MRFSFKLKRSPIMHLRWGRLLVMLWRDWRWSLRRGRLCSLVIEAGPLEVVFD